MGGEEQAHEVQSFRLLFEQRSLPWPFNFLEARVGGARRVRIVGEHRPEGVSDRLGRYARCRWKRKGLRRNPRDSLDLLEQEHFFGRVLRTLRSLRRTVPDQYLDCLYFTFWLLSPIHRPSGLVGNLVFIEFPSGKHISLAEVLRPDAASLLFVRLGLAIRANRWTTL